MSCTNSLKDAYKIVRHLRQAGYKAYYVGGAVRDMVMGRAPKDIDIATDASPEQVAGLFERTYPVGAKFGVTLVKMGERTYEVARFRSDGVYEDGRRPAVVTFTDEIEDVRRRDFTMNALLYDPEEKRVIDHVGGVDDINNKIVRAIGIPSQRFGEDRLRILRCIRFAAGLEFTIEPKTFSALKAAAPSVGEVSAERIGEELAKMFSGAHPDRALTLLDETGLLEVLLPEIAAMRGVEQPLEFHPEGDVYTHTLIMLGMYGGGSSTLAWGILLHDVGKPVTATHTARIRFNRHDIVGADIAGKVLGRLRYPNNMITRVQMLVKNHLRFIHVPEMKKTTLRRFLALDGFDELLELYRLDCLASHGNLEVYDLVKNEAAAIAAQTDSLALPKPLLDGNDLIKLNYTPGPVFSEIINRVIDAEIEGSISTKEEAIALVLDEFPR